jgi:hypothetical protein
MFHKDSGQKAALACEHGRWEALQRQLVGPYLSGVAITWGFKYTRYNPVFNKLVVQTVLLHA